MRVVREKVQYLSLSEQAWLGQAMHVATFSKEKHRHGAVLVKSGSVVATGYNRYRNDPNNLSDKPEAISIHAEADALRDTSIGFFNCVLYVARINKAGNARLSRPCDRCFALIQRQRIKEVIYTTN